MMLSSRAISVVTEQRKMVFRFHLQHISFD